jgi:hypothetical protein
MALDLIFVFHSSEYPYDNYQYLQTFISPISLKSQSLTYS